MKSIAIENINSMPQISSPKKFKSSQILTQCYFCRYSDSRSSAANNGLLNFEPTQSLLKRGKASVDV